jgi:hypothetical protein
MFKLRKRNNRKIIFYSCFLFFPLLILFLYSQHFILFFLKCYTVRLVVFFRRPSWYASAAVFFLSDGSDCAARRGGEWMTPLMDRVHSYRTAPKEHGGDVMNDQFVCYTRSKSTETPGALVIRELSLLQNSYNNLVPKMIGKRFYPFIDRS